MNDDTCPTCGETWAFCGGELQSLAYYPSPKGHDHDRNYRLRTYVCQNGHLHQIRRVPSVCPVEGCEFNGPPAVWPEVVR